MARSATLVDLDDYVRRIVDDAPPLTPDQLDRLALLLRLIPAATGSDG